MKFSSLVVTMPVSSVREWLDHELEVRGIDAVVYTRYILSILQQDNYIHEPPEREFFPIGNKKKENVVGNGKGKSSKPKVSRTRIVDCEELKKTAAVECLMSVTEQKCGIKELVEELCSRLKSIQIEGNYTTQESVDKPVLYEKSCAITQYEEHSSPEEQAEKYYAAFPSLSGNSDVENISDRATSEQHTSIWDRKKVVADAKECIHETDGGEEPVVKREEQEEEEESIASNDSKVDHCDDPTTLAAAGDATGPPPPPNVAEQFGTKSATDDAKQSRHQHLIKLKHTTKISGDHHVCRKPSFIVPKYKCRILKERVQLHKERSPFNLFELTKKCFSSKRESADERCKKSDDNDVDSSFEDGESEDVTTEDGPSSKSVSVHLRQPEVHSITEDVPLLTLEAKFNESLAAIWMELPIQSGTTTVDGEKQNADLMSWIASLREVNDGDEGFEQLLQMFEGDEKRETNRGAYLSENPVVPTVPRNEDDDDDEKRFVANNTGYLSILDHLLNGSTMSREIHPDICSESSSEITSLKNVEDPNRVWKCEGRRVHGFIKGGVYGFESLESYWDGDDSSDIGTLALDNDILESCSPAFASDGDALLEWWKEKTCDSAEFREDLKLIWEVLGTLGNSENANYDNDAFSITERNTGGEGNLATNVWEQLDHLDQDLISNFTWDCAFGLSENTDGSRHPQINVWSESDGEMSTDKCKSMSSLIEEALRMQWKDEEENSFCHSLLDVCGRSTEDSFDKNDSIEGDTGIVIGGLFPANTDDLLKMTRSYDSYLNRDFEESEFENNRLSKIPDVSRHSDPNLFDKKCTLTHHKGESLFIEVQPRLGTDLLSIGDLRFGLLPGRFMNVGELTGDKVEIGESSKPPELNSDEFVEESLLTSPMTHFRPIRQFSCDSDETASSVGGDVVEVAGEIPVIAQGDNVEVHVKKPCQEKVENRADQPMFFEDENGMLRLSDSNSDGIDNSDSRYMIYKSQDVKQEETPSFVPKFKLRSDLEKFCQTEDPESLKKDVDILDVEDYGNKFFGGCREDLSTTNIISDLQFGSNSVLISKNVEELRENDPLKKVSCFNTCALPFGNETKNAWGTTAVFSLESCRKVADVKKLSGTEENGNTYGIETLNFNEFVVPGTSSSWSVTTCGPDKVIGDGQPMTSWPIVSSDCKKKVSDNLSETYFWSAQDNDNKEAIESEELKCMKEEIKNEEDELFEDINQMRALDLSNEWAEDNSMDDTLEWPSSSLKEIYQEVAVDYHEDEDCPELELINGVGMKHEEAFEEWSRNIDDVCNEPGEEEEEDDEDDDDEEDGDINEQRSAACVEYQLFEVPEEENDFLTNKFPSIPISNAIYSSDLEEEWIRAGKRFDVQIPKINQAKTRSRCNRKPCSFFLDGTCRRTDCKFSHDLSSITCRFWEEGSCFKGMTCPFLHGYPRISSPVFIRYSSSKEKNFIIESEADFPSLSKSVESTSSGGWIPSSFTVKRKKKRNRFRHNSTSIISKDNGIEKRVESDGS